MRLLPSFRRTKPRVAVIALDGVPHSFLTEQSAAGRMPNVASLLDAGTLRPIQSVYPTVSCVAWATFATGLEPGEHGIFGFTDRRPGSYELTFPNADNLRGHTIWRCVTAADRKCIAVNVPVTYPPTPLKGLTMVSGFLAPRLRGATQPSALGPALATLGYRIDVDAGLATENLPAFLRDARETVDARKRAALDLMRAEWDLMVCHIMTPDRVNHFLWGDYAAGEEPNAEHLLSFYQHVDSAIGDIIHAIQPSDRLLLIGDHGFCPVKRQVHVNALLREWGWLEVDGSLGQGLAGVAPGTRAYSLTPGRIYLSLEDREPRGRVSAPEYEAVLDELSAMLLTLTDPEDGSPVVEKVLRAGEAFTGGAMRRAPDLLVVPHDGYDLKASFSQPVFRQPGPLTGMHDYEGAFIYARDAEIAEGQGSLVDAAPTILSLLDVPRPHAMHGRSLLM